MGVRSDSSMCCAATARPDNRCTAAAWSKALLIIASMPYTATTRGNCYDIPTWFNILLLLVSLFAISSIGKDTFEPSRSLTHQTHRPSHHRSSCFSHSFQANSPQYKFKSKSTSSVCPKAIGSVTESSSSTFPLAGEPVVFSAHSDSATGSSRPDLSASILNTRRNPVIRILLHGADDEEGVFIKDMQQFAEACHGYLGSSSQVHAQVTVGTVVHEIGSFFNQTNVGIEDMLIFGVSSHGRVGNNLVKVSLSENVAIGIRDIFTAANSLPIHCTIEIFLDVCYAAIAAEQHGLYKIWPSDDPLASPSLTRGAGQPCAGPKMILWTAAGKHGVAYFDGSKGSYMLAAIRRTLEAHGPNMTRRELYRRITKRLEPLNDVLRRKNKAPQIPVIFSSVPDRDHVLDGYALQPLLIGNRQDGV